MTSISSVGLWPPSSTPHKMLVHCSSSLGGEKLHQPVLQLLEGVRRHVGQTQDPLALSSTWWEKWSITVLYITRRSFTRLSSRSWWCCYVLSFSYLVTAELKCIFPFIWLRRNYIVSLPLSGPGSVVMFCLSLIWSWRNCNVSTPLSGYCGTIMYLSPYLVLVVLLCSVNDLSG